MINDTVLHGLAQSKSTIMVLIEIDLNLDWF